MKKMFELEVGETTTVTVEAVDLGYATVDGVEYFVKGIDDFIDEDGQYPDMESNSLDCYYVTKDDEQVYILSEDSEFPEAIVKRIK